jgi:peptidoglycan/xylan/chitin deacetylase (PgdA/CDA1 family)
MTARRNSVVRWAAVGLYRTGLIRPFTRALGYSRRGPAFQILTHHRVNDDRDPFFPSLPTEIFERRMAYVARTCRVLAVEELVHRMPLGNVPRNAVGITFDDGYRDNLLHAAPILARYGLPATVFLATGFIGTGRVPWYDRLALAFKTTMASSVKLPWGEILNLRTLDDRLRALQATLTYFKRLSHDRFSANLEGLLTVLGGNNQEQFKGLMLSWDDVRSLVRLGFTIGAHTVTHPILSQVDTERARQEVLGSKAMIEAAGFPPPRAFAYPNGGPEDYNETVKAMVRQAGFTCAVTTRFGLNTPSICPYELLRGGPWEEDLPTYALKLAWYRWSAQSGRPTERPRPHLDHDGAFGFNGTRKIRPTPCGLDASGAASRSEASDPSAPNNGVFQHEERAEVGLMHPTGKDECGED